MTRRSLIQKSVSFFGLAVGLTQLLFVKSDSNENSYTHILEGRPLIPPSRTFIDTNDFFSIYGTKMGSSINYYLKEKGFVLSKSITLTNDKTGIIITTIYKSKRHFEIAEKAYSNNGSEENIFLPESKKVLYNKILS